jgi:choline-sulfatase
MYAGRFVHEIGIWDNSVAYKGTPEGWGHYFSKNGVSFTSIGKLDFERGAQHGISEAILPTYRDNRDVHALYREEEIIPRHDLLRKHKATGPDDSLESYNNDDKTAAAAVSWLKEGRPDDRPWVLYVNFNDLHRPWKPPHAVWESHAEEGKLEERDERFQENRSALHPYSRAYARHHNDGNFEDEDLRKMMIGYTGSVEILDRNVGRVLTALDDEGLRGEVLVVYASDHGYSLGEHHHFEHGSMYEESLRVPLIFAGPGIPGKRVSSEVVSMLDVFPTISGAVGRGKPEDMRGRSILNLLREERLEDREAVAFCEYHASGYPSSMFAVCTDEYKYVRCIGERPMLFNLKEDPHEMRDLAALQPENPEVKTKIRELEKLLSTVCSPEQVDARAKADQRSRREELRRDGRLFEELAKRRYELNAEKLVYTEDG